MIPAKSCGRCGGACPGRSLIIGSVAFLVLLIVAAAVAATASGQTTVTLTSRIEGMLVGSMIGDAYGAPTEFAPPDRSQWTAPDAVLTREGIEQLAASFSLTDSARPADPYGPWTAMAPVGTLTDDTRFKVMFFRSLDAAGGIDRQAFARALLAWHDDSTGVHGALPARWLREYAYAARWILGERDPSRALPPERLWGGIPTIAGQMAFLPIAALAPRKPDRAYDLTWEVDFLDNGIAKDLNAALVAGISAAFEEGADLARVEQAMRATDPYRHGRVPWITRSVDRWLDFAHDAVNRSGGKPADLFRILENEMGAITWWEAWAPISVVFSCALLADGDPLATMRLILEFGHDTDSYLAVAGALFGALHGSSVFPPFARAAVSRRLREEYGVGIGEWMVLVDKYRLR